MSDYPLASEAIVLKNELEMGLKAYTAHFNGPFGPFPAVKLFRVLSALCTDYTENLHHDELRSLAWIIRAGRDLSRSLPECASWWQMANKTGMGRREDLITVAGMMRCSAQAIAKSSRIAAANKEKVAAVQGHEITELVNTSVATLTGKQSH